MFLPHNGKRFGAGEEKNIWRSFFLHDSKAEYDDDVAWKGEKEMNGKMGLDPRFFKKNWHVYFYYKPHIH